MTERVLIATSWHRSAVSDQFRALARVLHDAGTEVHWLDDRRHADVTVDAWVAELHRWPGTGRPRGVGAVRFADQLVRRLRPQTVIANFAAVTPLGLAARRAGVDRRVCWYHTLSEQNAIDSSNRRRIQQAVALRLRRVSYRSYTDVVAVSRAAADDFADVFGRRGPAIHVRHNAVVDGEHRTGPAGASAPIVAAGRLDPSKGYDVLVRAASLLPGRRRIVIMGEGGERDALSALAGELGVDLELPGTVPHAEIRSHMAGAAVVAVPSRAEAFGLVAIEGLAAGVPVVASRVGGLAEVVRDEVSGRLVAPDHPDQLASALARALDPAANATMGDAARRDYLDRFEVRSWGADLADWLLADRPPA